MRLLAVGDVEPEMATSCSQVGLQEERWRHRPTYRTFHTGFFWPTGSAGTGIGQGLASQWLTKLGTYPTGRNQSLTPLVVPCFACRQEPGVGVLSEH